MTIRSICAGIPKNRTPLEIVARLRDMNRQPFRARTHELERNERRIERRSESKKLAALKSRLLQITAHQPPTNPRGVVAALSYLKTGTC
jgi:hypothetical protein